MLINLLNRKRTCIIFKDHVIRYVESAAPKINAVKNFGERYLPPGIIKDGKIVDIDTLSLIVDECFRAWKLRGKKVLFTVPDSSIVIRTHDDVPKQLLEKEIRGYLNLVLGEKIPLPFENPTFDYQVLNDEEENKKVLLIASPHQIIKDYQDLLIEMKLKPIVADLTSLSIYRLYHELGLADEELHLLSIQFDIRALNIAIFNQHYPVFTRHLKINMDNDNWNISRNLKGEEKLIWTGEEDEVHGQIQDMVTEVERIMNFYRFSFNQGKDGVSKILLTGDHPLMDFVFSSLKESITVDIERITNEFKTAKGATIPQQFYEAIGLSLKKEV